MCQAQTEAVFISHATTDPLACWDAGLVAWLAAPHHPVTTCMSGVFAYLSASYFPACICLPSFLIDSCRQHLCLLARPLAWLPFWTSAVQLHFVCFFFASQLSVLQQQLASCHSSLLSACLLSVCPAACLAVWLPSRGMAGWVLDNKHPTDPTLRYKNGDREGGREGRRKGEEGAVKDERRDKGRKRGIGREHIQQEVWREQVRGRE